MRRSDWSSDVGSSDLRYSQRALEAGQIGAGAARGFTAHRRTCAESQQYGVDVIAQGDGGGDAAFVAIVDRDSCRVADLGVRQIAAQTVENIAVRPDLARAPPRDGPFDPGLCKPGDNREPARPRSQRRSVRDVDDGSGNSRKRVG